jgi:hypothetical protein
MNELIASRSKVLGFLMNGNDYEAIALISSLRLNKWNINNFLNIGADANAPIFIEHMVKKRGANVNYKDYRDENSIFKAAVHDASQAFELLMEYGADYKQENKAGYNCLMGMVKHPAIVEKIIKDFDIHHTSEGGQTALSMALQAENKETIKLIILQSSSMNDIVLFKKQIKKCRTANNKRICDYAAQEVAAIGFHFKLQEQLEQKPVSKKMKI